LSETGSIRSFGEEGEPRSSVTLGFTTILARSGAEAAERISKGGFDGILLDFPRDLEEVVELVKEGGSPRLVEASLRKRLGGFVESWLYKNRFLLRALGHLPTPGPEVVLTGDREREREVMKDRLSLSLLEYRAMAGHVPPSRWREELTRASRNLADAMRKQTERILDAIKEGGRWLSISGVHARGVENVIRSEGHRCRALLLGKPYLGTPLEALSAELAEGKPDDQRVQYLVERHLEFVRDYVMVSRNLDDAYDKWLKDRRWAKLYHEPADQERAQREESTWSED